MSTPVAVCPTVSCNLHSQLRHSSGRSICPRRVSAAACTDISARARELLASVRSRSTLPCSVAVLLEAARDGRADAVRHVLKRVTSADVNATDRYG